VEAESEAGRWSLLPKMVSDLPAVTVSVGQHYYRIIYWTSDSDSDQIESLYTLSTAILDCIAVVSSHKTHTYSLRS